MMQFRLGNVFLHLLTGAFMVQGFDIKVFPCVGSFPFTGWGVCQEQAVMRFWTKVWKKHRRPASTVHLENSFTICIPKRNQKYSSLPSTVPLGANAPLNDQEPRLLIYSSRLSEHSHLFTPSTAWTRVQASKCILHVSHHHIFSVFISIPKILIKKYPFHLETELSLSTMFVPKSIKAFN